jgi:hypothetical protein
MRFLKLAALAAGVAGLGLIQACATHPAEPILKTVEVKVPVAVSCPDKRAPAPTYPDTAEALAAAPDLFERVKLLLAGRTLRAERLKEDDGQIAACSRGVPDDLKGLV